MAQSVPPGDIATQPGSKIVSTALKSRRLGHAAWIDTPATTAGAVVAEVNRRRETVFTKLKKKAVPEVSAKKKEEMPGTITTKPGTKVVFNAPYDDKQTDSLKIINSSARRIGWAIKTTNMKRIRVDPGCGVLDPKETILVAVSCDAFAFGQEDTNNDRITVEWTNTPDGAAKQFRNEWFQGDGMVRRKNLPIQYTH